MEDAHIHWLLILALLLLIYLKRSRFFLKRPLVPFFTHSRWLKQSRLSHVVKALNRLRVALFDCYLSEDYADNVYFYERRLHVAKQSVAARLGALGVCLKKEDHQMLLAFERVYEAFLACAMLRYRVIDATLFLLCPKELGEINDELNQLLCEMSDRSHQQHLRRHVAGLLEKIEGLQHHYQNILQVTARDPESFYLFIVSLSRLAHELHRLMGVMR